MIGLCHTCFKSGVTLTLTDTGEPNCENCYERRIVNDR